MHRPYIPLVSHNIVRSCVATHSGAGVTECSVTGDSRHDVSETSWMGQWICPGTCVDLVSHTLTKAGSSVRGHAQCGRGHRVQRLRGGGGVSRSGVREYTWRVSGCSVAVMFVPPVWLTGPYVSVSVLTKVTIQSVATSSVAGVTGCNAFGVYPEVEFLRTASLRPMSV